MAAVSELGIVLTQTVANLPWNAIKTVRFFKAFESWIFFEKKRTGSF